MPATSPEAIARARERSRIQSRNRIKTFPEYVEAVTETTLVVSCERCFAFFDTPRRRGGRIRRLCDECNSD